MCVSCVRVSLRRHFPENFWIIKIMFRDDIFEKSSWKPHWKCMLHTAKLFTARFIYKYYLLWRQSSAYIATFHCNVELYMHGGCHLSMHESAFVTWVDVRVALIALARTHFTNSLKICSLLAYLLLIVCVSLNRVPQKKTVWTTSLPSSTNLSSSVHVKRIGTYFPEIRSIPKFVLVVFRHDTPVIFQFQFFLRLRNHRR